MNALIIVGIAIILFFLGYRFYAKKLESLWGIDPKRSTPAYSKHDSIDYVPAKNWLVLFGHHFASIAGAGPIVGPVLACALWGWLPALVWIVLGTIFIGAVHDFGALFISVREEGRSIADIAKNCISKKARLIFSLFVWLALNLVIAVFVYLCSETFIKNPRIVIPSLGLIPLAILIGFLIYNLKINFTFTTILGLILLVGLIILGQYLPVTLAKNSVFVWTAVLLAYAFIASVLPVNILLQPRDYLCSYLLFFGLGAGLLGIFIKRPILSSNSAFYGFNSLHGSLWPTACVIVACGAVSGFHSLVASGTTSKQIASEGDIRKIGYGGMVLEGLLAIMVLVAVSSGISASFTKGGEIDFFSRGYAYLTSSFLGSYGGFIALLILNAFIITTLDTATRINRYISEELLNIKNRYISTATVVLFSALLVFSGNWKKVWPVFGASNQLVAALALFVFSCWLMAKGKKSRYALLPAFFMSVTAINALLIQSISFFKFRNYLLFTICLFLIILSLVMISEVISLLERLKHA